jgi:hypothetical protein
MFGGFRPQSARDIHSDFAPRPLHHPAGSVLVSRHPSVTSKPNPAGHLAPARRLQRAPLAAELNRTISTDSLEVEALAKEKKNTQEKLDNTQEKLEGEQNEKKKEKTKNKNLEDKVGGLNSKVGDLNSKNSTLNNKLRYAWQCIEKIIKLNKNHCSGTWLGPMVCTLLYSSQ